MAYSSAFLAYSSALFAYSSALLAISYSSVIRLSVRSLPLTLADFTVVLFGSR